MPWGVYKTGGAWTFATAEECAYPLLLCSRMADCVANALGLPTPREIGAARVRAALPDPSRVERASLAAVVGRQPRGLVVRQLVPEFVRRIRTIATSPDDIATALALPAQVQKELSLGGTRVPGPSKLLLREETKVLGCGGDPPDLSAAAVKGIQLEFGVYHTPLEFLAEAKRLEHPFDSADFAPGAAREAVYRTLTLGEEEIFRIRREKLALWRRWKSELSEAEKELHRRMPHRVASVYRGKAFLLLKRILRSSGFCYCEAVDGILAGCRITGDLGISGIFHPRLREVELILEDIWRAASRSRAALAYGMRPSQRPDDDRELLQLTLDEVKAGKSRFFGG